MMTKKIRSSGIELLRIVAMFLIILYHFSVHTEWTGSNNAYTSHEYFVDMMSAFGKTGVAVFFMITGYFLQKSRNSRNVKQKVFSIVRPVWFYSIVLFVLFVALGIEKIGFTGLPMNKNLAATIFPIISNFPWWFAVDYVVLILLSPYLKKMLDALSSREIFRLLVICYLCIFCASLFGSLIIDDTGGLISLSSCFPMAISGYLVSRMEKSVLFKKNKKKIFLLGAISLVFVFIVPFIANYMHDNGWASMHASFFWSNSSPLTLVFAINLLLIFKDLKINSKAINYIASLTFGIYLIHDYSYVREWIWNSFFGTSSLAMFKQRGIVFLTYSFVVVSIVFVACGLIEATRKLIVYAFMHIVSRQKVESRSDKK